MDEKAGDRPWGFGERKQRLQSMLRDCLQAIAVVRRESNSNETRKGGVMDLRQAEVEMGGGKVGGGGVSSQGPMTQL